MFIRTVHKRSLI